MAPSDLPEVVELGDMRKVYATVVSKEDYLEHKDGRKFDAAEFESHPERYTSSFAQKASWTTVGSSTVLCAWNVLLKGRRCMQWACVARAGVAACPLRFGPLHHCGAPLLSTSPPTLSFSRLLPSQPCW